MRDDAIEIEEKVSETKRRVWRFRLRHNVLDKFQLLLTRYALEVRKSKSKKWKAKYDWEWVSFGLAGPERLRSKEVPCPNWVAEQAKSIASARLTVKWPI